MIRRDSLLGKVGQMHWFLLLTVVVIAISRTRDKWPVEGTLARLDGTLQAAAPRLGTGDLAWGAAGLACLAAAIGLG